MVSPCITNDREAEPLIKTDSSAKLGNMKSHRLVCRHRLFEQTSNQRSSNAAPATLRQKRYVDEPDLALCPEDKDSADGTIIGEDDFVIGVRECDIVMPPLSRELQFQEHLLLSPVPSPRSHLFFASAAVKLEQKNVVVRDCATESERIATVGHVLSMPKISILTSTTPSAPRVKNAKRGLALRDKLLRVAPNRVYFLGSLALMNLTRLSGYSFGM